MEIGKITSENPEIHWRFLNCKNKIVMDMGCPWETLRVFSDTCDEHKLKQK